LPLPPDRGLATGAPLAVTVGIRPEHITRAAGGAPRPGSARLDTVIELLQPTGPRTYATVRCAGQPIVAELQAHDVSAVGTPVALDLDLRRMALFDAASGNAL
jgi:multiple sugar transport system ATP-binding protein